MICVECKKTLHEDAQFCSYCGAKQSHEDVDAASTLSSMLNIGGQKISQTLSNIGDGMSSVASVICDVNGDGKVDIEDFKHFVNTSKQLADDTLNEATKLGKEVAKSETVKDAAAFAAVGAAVAIPVPLVGPLAGAAIGAGLSLYKNFVKKS